MAMDTFLAINIIEGIEEVEGEQEVIDAWQYLIDTGIVWNLQGYYGRTARALIDEGICYINASEDALV
jgi:hypothetical protein